MSDQVTKLAPDYAELEVNAIDTLNDLFKARRDGGRITKLDVEAAKLAQGALASVQSHEKSKLTSRGLDLNIARALAPDRATLADYIGKLEPNGTLAQLASGPTES